MKTDVNERLGPAELANLEAPVELSPCTFECCEFRISRISCLKPPGCLLNLAKDILVRREAVATPEAPVAPEHRPLWQRHPRRHVAARVHELDDDIATAHAREGYVGRATIDEPLSLRKRVPRSTLPPVLAARLLPTMSAPLVVRGRPVAASADSIVSWVLPGYSRMRRMSRLSLLRDE